jgi:hypothetical protein
MHYAAGALVEMFNVKIAKARLAPAEECQALCAMA